MPNIISGKKVPFREKIYTFDGMKIGLISDTHGFLHERIFHHFKDCDEIWHAGDVGDVSVIEQLEQFKPTRGVYGNIDDKTIQSVFPEELILEIEGVKIYMIHIGGTPPRYATGVRKRLEDIKPQLFICGHSHILKVMADDSLGKMLYMNPGAAGNHGFHQVRTLLRFDLEAGRIKNLEVIELGKRGM